MSNEPTPETESWCGWGIGGLQVVPASFARKLERERDEVTKQRDALADALSFVLSCGYDGPLPEYARDKAQEALAAVKGENQ